MRLAHFLTVAASLTLAACSVSDEEARRQARASVVQGCMEGARSTPPPVAGFSWQSFCDCAADRIVAGKTAEQLRGLRPDSPEQRQAAEQCMAQMVPQTPAPVPAAGGEQAANESEPAAE